MKKIVLKLKREADLRGIIFRLILFVGLLLAISIILETQ